MWAGFVRLSGKELLSLIYFTIERGIVAKTVHLTGRVGNRRISGKVTVT